MKTIFKKGAWMLLSIFMIMACSPLNNDDYSLGSLDTVNPEQVSFTMTKSDRSDNIINFTNTSDIKYPVTVAWNLGNGAKGNKKTMEGQYPQKGDYTVTLTLYAADGSSATKSVVVQIADDDFGLIDTPAYRNLTGGIENTLGKIWVFDQYNNYAKEVADATGLTIKGHLGLGPQGSYGQEWWGAAPNEKNTWTMYDFKFTFIQEGVQFKIKNKGQGYGRKSASASVGGYTVTNVDGDDATFTFNGGNFNFSILEGGKYPQMTLSDNSFMGYYAGSQVYDIVYQTNEVMCLRVNNTVEGQDWVFVYCLEELNVSEPPLVKEPKAIPLSENFEGKTLGVPFIAQDMGGKSGVIDNPLPLPINESDKVYRYQKSGAFYSNLSFVAADYKFELTQQNKIRLKVYIPSYNDYTTSNAVAGEWIAESRLLPMVAVKLQDNDKGDMSWDGQTEIVKKDLVTDKWIELEFDFSNVKDLKTYDKIVIQFGGEGHAGAGFFFFDDFKLSE
ncbi:MAG: PKD domain-containing protein [Candidatus Saccharimonadaceae bacterium]